MKRNTEGDGRRKSQTMGETGEEFTFEEPTDYDLVKEKFEIIGIKMDIHKNGVLFLKELEILLLQLDIQMRGPVGNFLIAYMKQTKKQTIQLPVFVNNIHKAYLMDKFKLKAMIEFTESHTAKSDELREVVDSIGKLQHPPVETKKEPPPPVKACLPTPAAKKHPPKVLSGGFDNKKRTVGGEPMSDFRPSTAAVSAFPARPSAASKDAFSQATYSRHTKSSLAHQKKSVGGPIMKERPEAKKPGPKPVVAGYNRVGRRHEIARPEPQVAEAFSATSQCGTGFRSVTDDMIQQNNIEKVAMKLQIPEKAISSEERELKRCTFKPELAKRPTKYQNVKSRLLNHFGENDSISEEDEFAYELKHEMKKRRALDWQNRSCDGFLGVLMGASSNEQASYTAARPLSPAFSKDNTIEMIPPDPEPEPEPEPLILQEKVANKVGRSSSVDKLCVDIVPDRSNRVQWNNNGDRDSSISLSLATGDPMSSSTPRGGEDNRRNRRKPHENAFDAQNGKKLTSLLQNGYSYKHQEKRKYGGRTPKNDAGVPVMPAGALATLNNFSGIVNASRYVTRCETAGNSSPNFIEAGKLGATLQGFDMASKGFTAATQEGPAGNLSELGAGSAHSTGVGFGGRLRNVLGNAEQVDKMKKLHSLYAAQKGKCK